MNQPVEFKNEQLRSSGKYNTRQSESTTFLGEHFGENFQDSYQGAGIGGAIKDRGLNRS